jgi:3-phenylpropionate/cinnamic acid dioxygenase small subunit
MAMQLEGGTMATDREEIIDLMTHYAWVTDTKSYDQFDEVFAPDIVNRPTRHPRRHPHDGSLAIVAAQGPDLEAVHGITALQEFARKAIEPLDATQHLFSNFHLDIDGDDARWRNYAQAAHVKNNEPDGPLFIVALTYYMRARRTAEGWRITDRRTEVMWTSGNPAVLAHLTG